MRARSAGIIAAGEGSRFRKAGMNMHKPMIPVKGFPLIGHALRNFEAAGIRRVVIIFNESEGECVEWVEKNFASLQCEFIVKSTRSSFESFWLVGQKLGVGRHIMSTVDALTTSIEVEKMADSPPDSGSNVYLGVVRGTDDEKPVWVRMENGTNRITALGEKIGEFVTAGFYNVTDALFVEKPGAEFSSLREYLKWLVLNKVPVYGVPLSSVADVDFPKDIKIAEDLLTQWEKK